MFKIGFWSASIHRPGGGADPDMLSRRGQAGGHVDKNGLDSNPQGDWRRVNALKAAVGGVLILSGMLRGKRKRKGWQQFRF